MIKEKKGDVNFIVLVVGIFVVFALIFFIRNISENALEDEIGWQQSSEVPIKYDNIDSASEVLGSNEESTATEEVESGGASGGGGSGGSSGSEESSDDGCYYKTLAYSIVSVSKDSDCLEYDGDVCVSQLVFCSSKISNDGGSASEFDMEVAFVLDGNSSDERIGTETALYFLESGEAYLMAKSIQVDSVGEDGAANQKINCFFNTVNTPLERVC